MPGVKDETMPGDRWAFDEGVAAAFDDMLRRSIPQHDAMREACFAIGSGFVADNTDIIDLGCSRGESLAPFVRQFGAFNRYIGIDSSAPMRDAARERFKGLVDQGVVSIRDDYPPTRRASLVLSVLTLQFVPLSRRQKAVGDIFRSLLPGGALVVVEKVLGATEAIDGRFVEHYHNMKASNGYSWDAIERKRTSLEGVLVPLTADWNERMLRDAGFGAVDCFWRWMNFAGWIAVKV